MRKLRQPAVQARARLAAHLLHELSRGLARLLGDLVQKLAGPLFALEELHVEARGEIQDLLAPSDGVERAGQPLSLLLLDDIFGSLDEDRQLAVVELLRSLADRFPQVILLTHLEEMRAGIAYAHARGRRVLVAINTFPRASETDLWHRAVDNAAVCGADAVILADLGVLDSDYEALLLQRMIDYPQVVEAAAQELAPHVIAFYLKELAADFHSYYNASRFLVEDDRLRLARLALIAALAQVMRNGLDLLGVSAPEKM